MDSLAGLGDGGVQRDAEAGAGSCRTFHLTAGVAVAIATAIVFTGLLMFFGLGMAAPAKDQTPTTAGQELVERPRQCGGGRRNATQGEDSGCGSCPAGWLRWGVHCYFISVGLEENLQWNKSAEFCLRNNSSLAVIRESEEMEFIQGVMLTFPHFPFLWVGLTDSRQEGEWLWGDGTDVQHYMRVTVEWDADNRDCADLRGGGALFADYCDSYGPWICKRESSQAAHI